MRLSKMNVLLQPLFYYFNLNIYDIEKHQKKRHKNLHLA